MTGFTETLPSKKTETGAWGAIGKPYGGPEVATVPISFPIPLEEAIAASNVHYIGEFKPVKGTGDIESGSKKILNANATTGAFEPEQEITGPGIPAGALISKVIGEELTLTKAATETKTGVTLVAGTTSTTGCTGGTAAEPKADPGNLCVYAPLGSHGGIERIILAAATSASGASRSGALLLLAPLNNTAIAFGTWAVTAP